MTFSESVSTCLKKYADFNGRAVGSEYWWFVLFDAVVSWGINLASEVFGLYSGRVANGLSALFSLATLLPLTAVAARRLHDVNRSGWWQLIAFTIIGIIPLLRWLCKKGDENANQYGRPVRPSSRRRGV